MILQPVCWKKGRVFVWRHRVTVCIQQLSPVILYILNLLAIPATLSPAKLLPGNAILTLLYTASSKSNNLQIFQSYNLLIQTRGDSSPAPDKPVPFSNIAGKVVQVEDGPKFIPPAKKTLSKSSYRINRIKVWCLILIKKLSKKLNLVSCALSLASFAFYHLSLLT